MVNYVYTASNVLAGLSTAGCARNTQEQLARWMVSKQQEEGGWGESKKGYEISKYVSDNTTLSQTAVALTGLLLYYERLRQTPGANLNWLTDSIDNGVDYLIRKTNLGRHFVEKEFTGVLIKGLVYGRYEFLPAYTTFYVLGLWQQLKNGARAQTRTAKPFGTGS